MTLILDAGMPATAAVVSSRPSAALATAVAVGLLVAGTLGTISAVIVGTALTLLGAPEYWAATAAGVTAAASLVPSAALARCVWRVETEHPDI